MSDQQRQQQHMHGERRLQQIPFDGPERRQPMSFGETGATDQAGEEGATPDPAPEASVLQDNEDEQKRLNRIRHLES